ncbi:MAG: aldehyde dehydrogenase [Chloroflexi bacterium]|nr:aldehyde dehydrogenase [Chloroflexota bacterium]
MTHGWAGTQLAIDLTQGEIEKRPIDPGLYETYLGGMGIGAKILWDRVPPEVAPFSPDNLLVFAAGVLIGTTAPTAAHGCVSFKSPLTNLTTYSHMGGFWASELKHAGYDTLIISGKSPSPVYLWLNGDRVEIRDASHLLGKDTAETQRAIRKELRNQKAQVICIGPAGENKAYLATIEQPGTGSSSSRTGPGAIMGDKNLKAIAIYGKKDIGIARPAEFNELCQYILDRSEPIRKLFTPEVWCRTMSPAWDTAWYGNADEMPAGVGFESYKEANEAFLKKYLVRETSCNNCPAKCQAWVSLPDGIGYFMRCESFCFSLTCKIPDIAFSLKCANLCIKYGLDTKGTGRTLGYAIDLYQRGILTKEDTGGMALEFGKPEVAYWLLEQMAYRRGIGKVLADGTAEIARVIGKGAEKYAHLVKKVEKSPDFCTIDPTSALTYATNDSFETHAGPLLATTPWYWGEERDKYIRDGWWLYPTEWRKYLDVDYSVDYDGVAELTYYSENARTLANLTGLCWWWAGFMSHTVIKIDTMTDLISHATGMELDKARTQEILQRVRTLVQANNVRLGLRRQHDAIPKKMFGRKPTLLEKELGLVQLEHDKFEKQRDRYYAMRGWNSDAVPTGESLDKLGLDFVREDLTARGILARP